MDRAAVGPNAQVLQGITSSAPHERSEEEFSAGRLSGLLRRKSPGVRLWAAERLAEAFHRSARAWMREVERTPVKLKSAFAALAALTMDIDEGRALRQASLKVHGLVSRRGGEDRRLGKSRRLWLRRLKGRDLLGDLIAFWKRNFARMLPDPRDAGGSNYAGCAEWLAALHELAPQAYAGAVRRWAVAHHRRPSLWAALRRKGLPLEEERRPCICS